MTKFILVAAPLYFLAMLALLLISGRVASSGPAVDLHLQLHR